MDTYTIAEAARLVGTSRGKLYQALRAGHLQGGPAGAFKQKPTVSNTSAGLESITHCRTSC